MYKLLNAGFYRYKNNILFRVTLVVSLLLGVFFGNFITSHFYIEDISSLLVFLIYAILFTLTIGREFSDGIIRNKIVLGYRRYEIFMSEVILALIVSIIMMILFMIGFTFFSLKLFTIIPADIIVKLVIGFILLNLAMVTIFVTVSFIFSSKTAVTSIISIVLIMVMWFSSEKILIKLDQPEYFVNKQFTSDGVWVDTEPQLNPSYIKNEKIRNLLTVTLNCSPYGQTCMYYIPFFEPILDPGAKYEPEKELLLALDNMPYYSLGLIIINSLIGCFVFCRKELK